MPPAGQSVQGAGSGQPALLRNWLPASPDDPSFRSGCEACAEAIATYVGGSRTTIVPKPPAQLLGAFQGVNQGWRYHVVVVKGGRVFDAFTGATGMPMEDYKWLWQYQDAIEFGF